MAAFFGDMVSVPSCKGLAEHALCGADGPRKSGGQACRDTSIDTGGPAMGRVILRTRSAGCDRPLRSWPPRPPGTPRGGESPGSPPSTGRPSAAAAPRCRGGDGGRIPAAPRPTSAPPAARGSSSSPRTGRPGTQARPRTGTSSPARAGGSARRWTRERQAVHVVGPDNLVLEVVVLEVRGLVVLVEDEMPDVVEQGRGHHLGTAEPSRRARRAHCRACSSWVTLRS